jgi:hypothetical protein
MILCLPSWGSAFPADRPLGSSAFIRAHRWHPR